MGRCRRKRRMLVVGSKKSFFAVCAVGERREACAI